MRDLRPVLSCSWLVATLVLVSGCADTIRAREIQRVRGPRVAAGAWSEAEYRQIEALIHAGKVVAVDRNANDAILADCSASAHYGTLQQTTELVEVETSELQGQCDAATHVVTGYTTIAPGAGESQSLGGARIASVSFAALVRDGSRRSMETFVTRTQIGRGALPGEYVLRATNADELCELPCSRLLVPHPAWSVAYVEKRDASSSATVRSDLLRPGAGTALHLSQEYRRPNSGWPYLPSFLTILGASALVGATVVLASDGGASAPSTERSSAVSHAGREATATLGLGALAVLGAAIAGGGLYLLFSPEPKENVLTIHPVTASR